MAKKRRPGRPRLGAEAKDQILQFRVTRDQRELIQAAADAKGQTTSEWLAALAIRSASRSRQK